MEAVILSMSKWVILTGFTTGAMATVASLLKRRRQAYSRQFIQKLERAL